MSKRLVLIIALSTLILGIALTLWADAPCRDFYTKCTEGGCGYLNSTEKCIMKCQGGTVPCGYPEPIQ